MIKNKDGSITFKNKTELKNYVKNKEADAIQQYTKKVRDVAVLDVAKDVSEKVSLLSFEALNLEHGLGKKRLKEFSDRYNSLFECFESGHVNFDDLRGKWGDLLPEDFEKFVEE